MSSSFLAQPSPLHTLMQSTLKHFRKTSKWGNNLFKTVCKWVLKAFKWLMLSYWRVFIYIILKVRLLKRNVSLPIIIFKWMGKICKFRQVGEVEGVLGALVGHVNVPIEPAHFAELFTLGMSTFNSKLISCCGKSQKLCGWHLKRYFKNDTVTLYRRCKWRHM